MILGLRTALYSVPDLAKAKAWYAKAFQTDPYFDEPFYVGFNIGGYELGLDPNADHAPAGPGGAVSYWGVDNADEALAHFLANGATLVNPVADVGEGIRVACVADPFGNLIGLIQNPHFKAER